MNTYHKIQTMFKREMKNGGRIIIGDWTLPVFEYLKDNEWVFTEKIDGTNIRVMFDGERITYAGKTDRAILHKDLLKRLHELFDNQLETFKEAFKNPTDNPTAVCFYGEGYGAGIQKGGCYQSTKEFILFDIKIGDSWLGRENLEELAKKFDIDIVPIVGKGTLQDGIDLVKNGLKSKWGNFIAEGIVARPVIELKDKRNKRIITKIKCKDFA